MKILALEAALGPFAAALDVDGVVGADRSAANDALEAGLGRIAALLDGAGVTPAGLDRIAVGIGPGSFTGIRIALSYAKALAYGADRELVGISSYDILTPPDVSGPCLTVVSGRAGVACARLHADGASTIACGPTGEIVGRLLAAEAARQGVTIVAAAGLLPALERSIRPIDCFIAASAENPAATVAALAARRTPAASLHAVTPDYGEMPAVTLPKAGTENQR